MESLALGRFYDVAGVFGAITAIALIGVILVRNASEGTARNLLWGSLYSHQIYRSHYL